MKNKTLGTISWCSWFLITTRIYWTSVFNAYLLSAAADLLNGCLSKFAGFRYSLELSEEFPSPPDHSVLLKMISGDDVLVSWVPLESVRYNMQQTTAKLTCNLSCLLFVFYSSRSLLSLIASFLLWHQLISKIRWNRVSELIVNWSTRP